MLSSKRLFGTNGIRGIVNKELTADVSVKIGTAIGTFFKKATLLVGHDARTSSPMLANAIISGLNATGVNTFYAGLIPTPAVQYAVKTQPFDGAVIITASHNPPEYNGFKVIYRDGIEISRKQEIKIENLFFDEQINLMKWNRIGKAREITGLVEQYIDAIKKHVNPEVSSRQKQFHIVVDAANSVGNLVSPRLLKEVGCKVTTIHSDIDGTFPGRPPEPKPKNLDKLMLTVKSVHGDLGVAYDGDADRAIFVDEQGAVVYGDTSFALIMKNFLKKNPGAKVVTPVSSSNLIKDVADMHGGEIILTKVGSTKVSHTMKRLHVQLGGEENGGIFYGPHQPVRDGPMATVLILNIMAETRKPLSQLITELPKYFIEKSNIACPEALKEKVIEKLKEQTKGLNINLTDGIKIFFQDGSTFIRPSGTEPIYRVFAEAKTKETASKFLKDSLVQLEKIIKQLKK